jgi:hypothetical protein
MLHPEQGGRLVLAVDGNRGFDRFLTLAVAAMYAAYGVSMGLFRGGVPGMVSGAKLPFLYLATLAVCFFPFYVLNCTAGPRFRAGSCVRLLLLAASANAAALSSYAPIGFFFTLTTSREGYRFLTLMHVGAFALSGLLSVGVIMLVFRAAAAQAGRSISGAVALAWGVLYAFVGTQMAWVLRPWIGSWSMPYTPFRAFEGSFIESVWRTVRSL